MSTTITNFYEHKPPSSVKPQQMVIFLHGLGADGQDLISLAPVLAQELPDAIFISPDAPFRCDMAPFGYQWFSLQEWTPESILRGVQTAAPILESFIAQQLKAHDIPASKLALVGFSQGTMMSLYVGPRYPEKIAGIVGYSGALVGAEELIAAPDKFHRPPVHLIHGMIDNVVPVTAYYHAREGLEKGGFPLSGHVSPALMHSIDQRGIDSGAEFLRRVLLDPDLGG
jgi:phospholipase/carboxylesterase